MLNNCRSTVRFERSVYSSSILSDVVIFSGPMCMAPMAMTFNFSLQSGLYNETPPWMINDFWLSIKLLNIVGFELLLIDTGKPSPPVSFSKQKQRSTPQTNIRQYPVVHYHQCRQMRNCTGIASFLKGGILIQSKNNKKKKKGKANFPKSSKS